MASTTSAAATADTPAPDPTVRIQWRNLIWCALALAIMVWAILSRDLWFLNYVHVVAGLLWTGIDLFMGFVIGPILRRVDFPVRRAIISRSRFAYEVVGAPANAPILLMLATAAAQVSIGRCSLLVGLNGLSVALQANSGGSAELYTSIPNQSSFVGLTLYQQAAAIDPATPSLVMTNGLRLVVGD